jgi:hypothetical protein
MKNQLVDPIFECAIGPISFKEFLDNIEDDMVSKIKILLLILIYLKKTNIM